MELHNLQPAKGSVKKEKRIGRGQGSGHGGTSTKGHKGAKARTGYNSKSGFEGGQMPLQRRLPKFGFKNLNRVEYVAINLDQLQNLSEKLNVSSFDPEVFNKNGLLSKNKKVKILGNGAVTTKIEVKAHAFSASAKDAIEKAGGSATIL
jgi:large subunit ribosomal protein L15